MSDGCWMCDSTDIAYTDILGLKWCDQDFNDAYVAEGDDDDLA